LWSQQRSDGPRSFTCARRREGFDSRFGVFEAGFASARDPKYTVVPQRERLKRQEEQRQDAKEMKEES
jgi:hypothetical protein